MVAPVNSGIFAYNGIAWTTLYKTKIECKPIRDSASRALVGREYTIDVEGHIGALPGTTTDAGLTSMRRLLEQPAGALTFMLKGFGPLNVNLPGGLLWDMAYGPWPDVLAWNPVGNDQGCLVRWRCVTQVPCEEAPSPKGIIEYCYSESWDIDQDGYTTRTITGHLTVQATRLTAAARLIPDNADAYRDQVIPDVPLGFRRTQSFDLSEDKRTLKFRFEDEELPQPLPPGVSSADVKHKVHWGMPKPGQPDMTATLSGTIVLPVGTPKSQVWDKILLIMRSRWPVGGSTGSGPFATGVVGGFGRATFLLSTLEIEDDVFGRGVSFMASALVLISNGSGGPQALLATSGLWAAIPGTSFVSMKRSLFAPKGAGLAWAPRGVTGLTFQNSDDAIVDLCGRENPPHVLTGKPKQRRVLRGLRPKPSRPGEPDPRTSWLQYRLTIRQIERDRVVRHKLLETNPVKPRPPLTGFTTTGKGRPPLTGFITQQGGSGVQPARQGQLINSTTSSGGAGAGTGPNSTAPQQTGVSSTTPDLVQRVGTPSFTIRLEGSAVRVAFPIPTPRLDTIGGVKLTQIDQDVQQEQIGSIGGLPIYRAFWRIDYILPDASQADVPMPVNPAVQ